MSGNHSKFDNSDFWGWKIALKTLQKVLAPNPLESWLREISAQTLGNARKTISKSLGLRWNWFNDFMKDYFMVMLESDGWGIGCRGDGLKITKIWYTFIGFGMWGSLGYRRNTLGEHFRNLYLSTLKWFQSGHIHLARTHEGYYGTIRPETFEESKVPLDVLWTDPSARNLESKFWEEFWESEILTICHASQRPSSEEYTPPREALVWYVSCTIQWWTWEWFRWKYLSGLKPPTHIA